MSTSLQLFAQMTTNVISLCVCMEERGNGEIEEESLSVT